MSVYYNENDPFAAAWLRQLVREGHIADGYVDERSILDVRPTDLEWFDQCHFFAGIGVWSYALRQAGWDDRRPIWTGSCPCQPFSAAGERGGFADERHLWPAFHHLIRECRPGVVLGEQVASRDGLAWLDLVHTDMENEGYAFGAVDLCAAGVGAPHIRQRLWWVANADGPRAEVGLPEPQERQGGDASVADHGSGELPCAAGRPAPGGLADADGRQRGRVAELRGPVGDGQDAGRAQGGGQPEPHGNDGRLADANGERRQQVGRGALGDEEADGRARRDGGQPDGDHLAAGDGEDGRPSPDDGFWSDADWLYCRDGKWRPVEPGTFPLAHGAAARVGRLRGYGNAVNAEAARVFIEAVME